MLVSVQVCILLQSQFSGRFTLLSVFLLLTLSLIKSNRLKCLHVGSLAASASDLVAMSYNKAIKFYAVVQARLAFDHLSHVVVAVDFLPKSCYPRKHSPC